MQRKVVDGPPYFDGPEDGAIAIEGFVMPKVVNKDGEEIKIISKRQGCELVQDDDLVVIYPEQVDAIIEYLTEWKATL